MPYLLSSTNIAFKASVVVGCCTAFQVWESAGRNPGIFLLEGSKPSLGDWERVLAVYFDETMSHPPWPHLAIIRSLYEFFRRAKACAKRARNARHETRATGEAFPRRACLSLLARLRSPEKPETITPVLQANGTLLSK